MNKMRESLPTAEWLDRHAAAAPDGEHLADVKAMLARREMGKKAEAEIRDVLGALKIKAVDVEAAEREDNAQAEKLVQTAEADLATIGHVEEAQLLEQITLDLNVLPATVTGDGPGQYYDFSPYHCWHRWYTHNEGGVTEGRVACDRTARRMHTYSRARGDGSGITDDNYVTSWVKLYFAFWPRRNGHVRAFVPYITRGWYQIYANDKWYNSKRAQIDIDVHVQLHQNYWGGYVKDDVFHLNSQNINRSGRIDTSRSLYSGGIPIGADSWVIAEVALKAYSYTSGGGSSAISSFWNTDYVHVPYVRFDFS